MTTESPARVPGWVLIKDGTSNHYRAPDGSIVGDYSYRKIYNEWKRTGVVPTSGKKNTGNVILSNSLEDTSTPPLQNPVVDTPLVDIELPTPKSTPASKTPPGRYNAKELATGYATILVVVTSVLAVSKDIPEAQMTDIEIKSISIPLGNLTESSKYNKSVGNLIVGKTDWITLGYALYQYSDRVAKAVRRKNAQPTGADRANQGTGDGQVNRANGTFGAPLPYTPKGVRGFTGTA